MPNSTLSEAAIALLKRRFNHERVPVTNDNRPLYLELAALGIMFPLHTFTGGDESAYRFTQKGWNLRDEFMTAASPSASPAESPALAG